MPNNLDPQEFKYTPLSRRVGAGTFHAPVLLNIQWSTRGDEGIKKTQSLDVIITWRSGAS